MWVSICCDWNKNSSQDQNLFTFVFHGTTGEFSIIGWTVPKCKCSERKMPCFFERAQHSVRSASREISSAAWSREPEMLIIVIDNAGIWWLFMVWSVQPHSSAHWDVYPVTFIISSLTGSFLRQHFPWAQFTWRLTYYTDLLVMCHIT